VIPDIATSPAPLAGGDHDGMNPLEVHDTRPGGGNRQERAHRAGAPKSLAEATEEIGMVQVHTCVSVHCDQCRDSLGNPGFEAHYPSADAALEAATAEGWLVGPGGRLWCSACGPVLTCEAEGHDFSRWRRAADSGQKPVAREHQICLRCGLHESRPVTVLFEGDPR
jgi:hypothetical protein